MERMHILYYYLKPKNVSKSSLKIIPLLVITCVIGFSAVFSGLVAADEYDDKINKLRQDNETRQDAVGNLQTREASLDATVASLQQRISATEAQIQKNEAEIANLQQDITEAKAEIVKQREVLGANIKQMYLTGQISTVEMLASSKDLSEFVDKQQYQESVQSSIRDALAQIAELKTKLEGEKVKSEKLLNDQEAMRARLAEERAESSRLLGLNKNQQAAYSGEIKAANAEIGELRRQQAIENARYNVGEVSYAGTSAYPWPDVYFPNTLVDPWGMYKRQCVSYTAWKVASTGRHMPYWGGHGNANQWDDNALADGIPVDNSPRVGDVGVSNAGKWGHVVYVEAVHDDGTITVSQYNAGWDGRYSTVRRSTGGLVFIHF